MEVLASMTMPALAMLATTGRYAMATWFGTARFARGPGDGPALHPDPMCELAITVPASEVDDLATVIAVEFAEKA